MFGFGLGIGYEVDFRITIEIAFGIAFEILLDTEYVCVIGHKSRDSAIDENYKAGCEFKQATTVAADVGVFKVANRETISDSWFSVGRKKFAIGV